MRQRSATSNPASSSPLQAIVARLDAAASGTPSRDTVATGFPSIDRVLGGGLRRQDLVVLTGDVGSGKSSLALAIGLRAAQQGHATTVLSAEMTADRVLERALAIEGRIAIDDLRAGRMDDETRGSVGAAALRLRDLPLTVRRLGGGSLEEVRQALLAVPRQTLLVIDSLQALGAQSPATATEEAAAAAVRGLKDLALEHDVVLLAVAHTPGLAPGRDDPRPTLDDLGGLGAIKQLADVVLAIYREEMYRPAYGIEGATELMVAKNRNGPTGYVDLYFYRKWLRFEDMVEPGR